MNALNSLPPDQRGAERKSYEPSMEEILASIRRIIADDQAFAVKHPTAPAMAPPEAHAAEATGEAAAPEALPAPGGDHPKPDLQQGWEASESHAPSAPVERQPDPPAPATLAPPSIAPFPVEAQFQFFKPPAARRPVEPSGAEEAAQAGRDAKPAVRSYLGRFEEPRPRFDSAAAPEPAPRAPPETLAAPQPEPVRPSAPGPETRAAEPPLVSPQTDAAVSSSFQALIASQLLPSGEGLTDMIREMLRPMLKVWLDDNLPVLVERLVRAEIERVARGGR